MEDSAIKEATLKQYRAGLAMVGKAIEACPEELWLSTGYKNRAWHVAYHTIFYTHFYVQPAEADFRPWSKHVPHANFLSPRPGVTPEPYTMPEPYSKADLLEYLELCRGEVEEQVPLLRLEEPSGFSWLPFNKMELQFYNIRHLQHHTGQLADRVRAAAGIGVPWAGSR